MDDRKNPHEEQRGATWEDWERAAKDDPELARQLAIAKRVIEENQEALRLLAES